MKTVLLFNSPICTEKEDVLEMSGSYPRLGIASIAGYLLERDIEPIIIDPVTKQMNVEALRKKIAGIRPDVVGIPAFTEEICDAAFTAFLVKKECPDCITVVGGPHSSAIPKETLEESPSIDIAVYGEGEETFYEIVSGKPFAQIKGMAYRNGRKINLNPARSPMAKLDALPQPAWQLFKLEEYRGGGLMSGFGKKGKSLELPVESARGCPFGCIFCFRVCGRKMRYKSPRRTVEDVERAVRFGASKIHFIEGTFGVNKELALELCNLMIERGLGKRIRWSSGGRANVLDEKLLQAMKDSGCEYLGYGVESGDQHILDIVGKGITIQQIIDSFKMCKRIGIKTEANFIIGHPYDTEETVMKTINFARYLEADHATFAIMVPFPGTEVRKMAEKGIGGLRVLSSDWRKYGKQMGGTLELEQLPFNKLVKFQAMAYKKFYFTPKRVHNLVGRLSFKRIEVGLRRLFS